jgi:hypothetical protein
LARNVRCPLANTRFSETAMNDLPHDRRRPETVFEVVTYEAYLAQPTLRLWIEEEARRKRNTALRDAVMAPVIRLLRRGQRLAARTV